VEAHRDARRRLSSGACIGGQTSVMRTALRSLRRWPPRTQIALLARGPIDPNHGGRGPCGLTAAVDTATCTAVEVDVGGGAWVGGLAAHCPPQPPTGGWATALSSAVGRVGVPLGGSLCRPAALMTSTGCQAAQFMRVGACRGWDRPLAYIHRLQLLGTVHAARLIQHPGTLLPARRALCRTCGVGLRRWEIARQICWAGDSGHGWDVDDGPFYSHQTLLHPHRPLMG
jgi:hypothetical protein